MNIPLPSQLSDLQAQLLDAAKEFSEDAKPISELLETMVKDVARATAEPLELFPVCHHSPASALQMVRRLHRQPPKVIYMELCEDLLSIVDNLHDCKLPVALQAFTAESEAFAAELLPLSVVAPLTEASAEYQAIAYCLQNPATQLIFVDRAVDFVFQWEKDRENEEEKDSKAPSEDAKIHGAAVGVEMGSLIPTFDGFLTFLLKNSNTRHFAEWWDRYVEKPIIQADYQLYREVMFLVGSLIRRLGRKDLDIKSDRLREKYMWTRIKQHVKANNINPEDAIFICGAAHTVMDVAEFGIANDRLWQIPDRTNTNWLYGLIPSSFVAIEYQFSHPAGTVSLAETNWKKNLKIAKLKPFALNNKGNKTNKNKSKKSPEKEPVKTENLINILTRSPALNAADEEQLLQWCAAIVALARKNGYLASTADSIAIYQTSILLGRMRNRSHPTPYDFQDAAITCLEKDRTPKKRNILQLCQILLGGDRFGTVGYKSLPPLAQNVYDRLEPLKINLLAKTDRRALMDFKQQPELLSCSRVLWMLKFTIGNNICQPIIGDRTLGSKPVQESWEIRIGKYQRQLIMLGYEGITIEQVLEGRLRQKAFKGDAKVSLALEAVEESILYLQSPRLTEELGDRSIHLLKQEMGAKDAAEIFARARRLVHYYRATPQGLPDWIKEFVATGYSHYAALLPRSFGDRGTSPEEIAGMLSFIFTLESLALSLGCNRSELSIGISQASQELDDPAKLGLLWTAQWLLKQRSLAEIRQFFAEITANPILSNKLPQYLSGFILALNFASNLSLFVVELLSELFATAPDSVLMPWLPGLIIQLRPHREVLQLLLKEAAFSFPNSLAEFETWQAPWLEEQTTNTSEKTIKTDLSEGEKAVRELLFQQKETTNAIASILEIKNLTWSQEISKANNTLSLPESEVKELLNNYPDTLKALSRELGLEKNER
ncbi:MAG: DUF5682 family protein [Prochloraceae cyanobacterium]